MTRHTLARLLALALLASFAVAACRTDPDPPTATPVPYTVTQSNRIAQEWLRQAPTYAFDGIAKSLTLTHATLLRCHGCWDLTYTFTSAHAGYGDRTGQQLAQVIASHEAVLTVEQYAVTAAVLDGRWDELAQQPLPR